MYHHITFVAFNRQQGLLQPALAKRELFFEEAIYSVCLSRNTEAEACVSAPLPIYDT